MSIRTKVVALAVVAFAITGGVASTTTPAEAHGFNRYGFNNYGFNNYGFNHHGFNRHGFNHYGFYHYGWGIGTGPVGSEIAANDGYGYGGDHYCRWVPRFDIYGHDIGRVRSCYY
jgi:hypothetical protein